MVRAGLCIAFLSIIVAGCAQTSDIRDIKNEIIKIVDFELSPDEDKIAFSAITPAGNTDIWVVDINGSNLKKLTFKDRSPSNHIARFFKKHKCRNYFEIDMCSPEWTKEGRIAFCQKLTKHDLWGMHIVSLRYFTIRPDGTDKRPKIDRDEIVRRKPFDPIHSFELSDQSEKHKKKIFLKDDILLVLDYGKTIPKKLIQ